jgi:hypothetical protein
MLIILNATIKGIVGGKLAAMLRHGHDAGADRVVRGVRVFTKKHPKYI